MVLDERSRHALYLKLEQILGPTEATTLMEHLPPVGWADVATKHDLKLELAALEQRVLATLHHELAVQTRTFLLAMIGSMVTFAGLTITATRLI